MRKLILVIIHVVTILTGCGCESEPVMPTKTQIHVDRIDENMNRAGSSIDSAMQHSKNMDDILRGMR